jgi:Rps23 Pro-64 3,4-dihydroxylase Tpa1-like proline 4-hydroxylase
MTRTELARLMHARLQPLEPSLTLEFRTAGRVRSFTVDDLLPEPVAQSIASAFPSIDRMVHKRNLGQDKYVGVQMNRYDPILEEAVYAFQEPGIVALMGSITGLDELMADSDLYAGGISTMCQGSFLNPHLDNSHDKDQKNFRVLNLLYYVSPGWMPGNGGNLELWDRGPGGDRRTIPSLFNRLVVMVTDTSSWHGVSKVTAGGQRRCVSNYYFSPKPADASDSYHVTTFRGRPGEKLKDVAMRGDNLLRTVVKKAVGEKLFRNPHVYKKDS